MKEIWMYLLPSGFIASFLTWLVNRRRERLKDMREEHSVYRELYEDLKVLIKKQSIEHGKLQRKIHRLERAFEEISRCVYRSHCPLRDKLPFNETNGVERTDSPNEADRTRGDPAA